MTKHNNLEEQEKDHACHCEGCECEDETNDCECEDCDCENCECGEHGCECDDCECDEYEHNHEHDHGHHHHHDHHECGCGHDHEENAANYLEDLQRLQAEFDNYRKRNEFIVLRAKEEGVVLAVEKILPVLDSFKSAQMHLNAEDLKGLLLVKEQLMNAIKQLGVTQIDALNAPFNPDFHNAVIMGEEPKIKSGIITEVFQDGFMYKDKVIRHSIVKVNK
jgi:molecular chaperone GrpE